jgi:glycosyltransferase involved in cell wall biosynthesis
MKILMATMGLDIGGAETHIVELSKQLKTMGYDVVIVSNGGVYVPEITAAGIRHYEAPLHRRSVGCMAHSLRVLRRVIREERPDVVHAHARIPGFLCGLLHRSMGFPFVTTAHWVFESKGLLRHLTNWGQRTVAVSDDIKAYLIREYGLPAEHISVTINGIDTEKFSPRCSGADVRREFGMGEEKVVCHVSRLDRETQLAAQLLIEIFLGLGHHVACARLGGGCGGGMDLLGRDLVNGSGLLLQRPLGRCLRCGSRCGGLLLHGCRSRRLGLHRRCGLGGVLDGLLLCNLRLLPLEPPALVFEVFSHFLAPLSA